MLMCCKAVPMHQCSYYALVTVLLLFLLLLLLLQLLCSSFTVATTVLHFTVAAAPLLLHWVLMLLKLHQLLRLAGRQKNKRVGAH